MGVIPIPTKGVRMKMLQKTVAASLALTALLAMTGCSSSDDGGGSGGSGGGSGGSALATGGFIKHANDSNSAYSSGVFDLRPYIKIQYKYDASVINGSGYIEEINLKYDSDLASDVICPNVTLKMGHTTLTDLTDTFATNIEQGAGSFMTVLDDASITFSAGSRDDFHTITLQEPFYYNGKDNLVVEIDKTSACNGRFEDVSGDVTLQSAVWTNDLVATTGSLSNWSSDMTFVFAGGVNTQHHAGTTGIALPFLASGAGRIQNLYTAVDINGSGPITGLALQLQSGSSKVTYTVSVKLGHSTLNDLGMNWADNYSDIKAVATDVNISIPAGLSAGDWIWVPLTSSFNYNGTDNLLVDMEVTASSTNTSNFVTSTLMSYNARARSYNSPDLDLADGTDKYLLNIKFRFNGATMDVVALGSPSGASQVLGGFGASGGQIQSLYKNTDLGTSGKVTAIYVQLRDNATAATITEHKVYLGHTNKSSLTTINPYVDSMDDYVLVYSGTTDISGSLKKGDWLRIPFSTSFDYDSTQNLTLLFSGATDTINSVNTSGDATRFLTASVGRNDNSVDPENGQGSWSYNGIVDIRLELQ